MKLLSLVVEVTKSLANNLVKFTQVICDDEDKRVINSNEIIAEKIKAYMKDQQEDDENYADEFSELLNSEKVEKLLEDKDEALESVEREEILEEARQEAERILEQARQEADVCKQQVYNEAEKEGYNSGYSKGVEEADKIKIAVEQERLSLQQDYEREFDRMESVLVDAILEVVENVFQIQFAEKREFVMHLLQGTLNKIEGSKDYLIRVSKEDFTVITEMKNEIQSQLPRNSSLELVEDLTLTKNQCLIETDGGVFDCSLDTQMDNLICDLRTLAGL